MTVAQTTPPAPPARVADPLQKFNDKKALASPIAVQLMRDPETLWNATKMARCAETLGIRFRALEDGNLKAALQAAYTCQQRLCPFCEWRRSIAWRRRLLDGLARFREAYPTHRAVLLTLTVKNGPLETAAEQLAEIHAGWSRMRKGRWFPTPFWFRRTEFTLPRSPFSLVQPQAFHPHLHVLLMVPASYWSRNYIRASTWAKEWQMAMRLDYTPIVDVRKAYVSKGVDDGKSPDMAAICEVAKYLSKATDLARMEGRVVDLAKQLHRVRMSAVSEGLRPFVRSDEPDSVEMTDEQECKELREIGAEFQLFNWDMFSKRYTPAA